MRAEFVQALLGGGLIGISATLLLVLSGRVAGISGILFGVLRPRPSETAWRWAFIVGLIAGGAASLAFVADPFANLAVRPPYVVALAGLLVGFGTRLGSGCTSGHGVCGISRLSKRSIVATMTFIATGALTVYLTAAWFGGAS